MPLELNPNHPVTAEIRDQWHKLCAIALFKLGSPVLEIESSDITDFGDALGVGASIVCDTRGGRLMLRLVNGEEALRLARAEGGLPL